MATLTAKQEKALADSDFAYIDSKGGRHLPIHDPPHVRAAMARFNQTSFESDAAKHTAHGTIVAAAKRFGIDIASFSGSTADADEIAALLNSLLESAIPKDETATFDADLSDAEDGDEYVTRSGKLFQVGSYPDKAFSLTESEMAEAVASFQPVGVKMSHMPTLLDGKLGQVTEVRSSDDGTSLLGSVRLPKWLHRILGDGPLPVSTEWDRATKRLAGLALVRTPRVSDAALMAAFEAANPAGFARHDTMTGQMALQRVHDVSVQQGAVCKAANMASRHESGAMQRIHDLAVEHGASCEGMSPGQGTAMYSGKPPVPPATRQTKGSPMTKFLDWLTGKAQEDGIELDAADLTAAFSNPEGLKTVQDAIAAKDAEIASLRAEQETQAASFSAETSRLATLRRQAEATALAESLVSAHRLPPGCVAAFSALAERIAATDDTATFAEGEQSTSALLATFAQSLPDLSVFTTGQIAPDEAVALFATTKTTGLDGTADVRDEVVERALAATPVGRKILEARKAAASASTGR